MLRSSKILTLAPNGVRTDHKSNTPLTCCGSSVKPSMFIFQRSSMVMKNILNTRTALLTTTALTVLVTLSPGFAYGNTGAPPQPEASSQDPPTAMHTYVTTEGETYTDSIGAFSFDETISSGVIASSNRIFKKDPSNAAELFDAEDTYRSLEARFAKDTENLTEEDKKAANTAYDSLMGEQDTVSDETKRSVMNAARRILTKIPASKISMEGWFSAEGDPVLAKYEETKEALTSFVRVNKALAGFNASTGSAGQRVRFATFTVPQNGKNVRRGGVYTEDMISDLAEGATLSVETIDATGTLTLKGKGTTEAHSGLRVGHVTSEKGNESSLKIMGATAENTKIGHVGSSQSRLKEFSVTGGFKHKNKAVYDSSSDEEKKAYDKISAPVETGDIHAQNIRFGAGPNPQEDGDTSTYTKQVYSVGTLDASHTSRLDETKKATVDDETTGNITIGNGVDVTVRHNIVADNILGEQAQPGGEAITSHLHMTGRNAVLDANIGRATYDEKGNINGYRDRISMLTISQGADVRLVKGKYVATGDGLWVEHGATLRTSEQNDITGTLENRGLTIFNERYSGDGNTSVDVFRAVSGSETRIEGPISIEQLVLKGEENTPNGKPRFSTLTFADPASGYAKRAITDWTLAKSAAEDGNKAPSEGYLVRIGSVQSENDGNAIIRGSQTFIAGTIDKAIAIDNPNPPEFKNIVRNGSNLLATFEVFDRAESANHLERGRYYGVRAKTKSAQIVASNIGVNVTEASGLIAAVQSIGNDHELRSAFENVLDGAASEASTAAQQVSATTAAQATETIRSLSHAASDAVSDRLASVRGGTTVAGLEETGVPSGDAARRNGFWSRASGGIAKQKSRKGVSGHDTKNYGLTIGLDSRVGDSSRAGAALSYSSSNMDGNGIDRSQTNIESYQIALYGSYDPGTYFVEGQVAFAHNDVKTSRKITFGGLNRTASGKYNAAQYSVTVAAGRPIHMDSVTITPKGGLFYSYTDPSQYTEKGAGGLNMTVDPASTQVLEANLGGSVSYEHRSLDGSSVTPEFRAAALYEFLGDEGNATAKYSGSGATFKTQGLDPSKLGGTLGVGVGYTTADGVWEIRADYDAEFRSGYVGHNGMLTGRINF